jgi:hypothetical protein
MRFPPPFSRRQSFVTSASSARSPSTFIAGSILVAWLGVVLDALTRRGWEGVSRFGHFTAAFSLYTAAGTLFGSGAVLLFAGYVALKRKLGVRYPYLARWLGPCLGAAVGVVAMSGTAFWTFSGEGIRATTLGKVGPWLVLVVAALGGALSAGVGPTLERLLVSARPSRAFALAAVALALALLLARIDLTVYVSLYSRLHTFLELTAGLLATGAFVVLLFLVRRERPRAEQYFNVLAGFGVVVTLFLASVEPARGWVTDALSHAWREPVYVGRMLSRFQIAEGFIRDPRGWRGATMSSVVRLRERYDITTTSRDPIWDRSAEEPAWFRTALSTLRGRTDRNIVVFYVDTLRADVARDPKIMPNLARFERDGIDFRDAYTTGSDTLHALPGMIGGSYDLFARKPNDVLHVARAAGFTSALFVAQSAHEFLTKMLPEFSFQSVQEVPDYAAGNENVWGYGADQPTSARLVDRTLDWIRDRPEGRFLSWMFNFDVHNWRELDEAYVRGVAKEAGLYDEADPIWRYKAVAHSIDAQFQRMLDGLRDAGIADDTIVLFVSDHGEGLGQNGFWVHSVFLWEGLVRVPLALRVPGLHSAVVNDVVSLADVAPTLARFMAPNADTASYQGEDLLGYLIPNHPKRRLPLLLMSTLKEVPVRLGLIDPELPWKLVLPLEGAVPELYDRRAADADGRDVSAEHHSEMLDLLNKLVRAPLFPRPGEAGDGSLDQAAKEGREATEAESERK